MVDEAINHHQATLMLTFPKHLIAGYRDFAATRLPAEQSRYRELSEHGQSPETMLIGCSDSRVAPETIFGAGPGELFTVRNVANLVPPYAPDGEAHGVSAALEFAVQVLRVKHIVVMGHAQCGGGKNLERIHQRALEVAAMPRFAPFFSTWEDPWQYAAPEVTRERLVRAGFENVSASLAEAPVTFADARSFRAFIETVVMRSFLAKLPAGETREAFLDTIVQRAADDDPPFTLDYWRLDIRATRP